MHETDNPAAPHAQDDWAARRARRRDEALTTIQRIADDLKTQGARLHHRNRLNSLLQLYALALDDAVDTLTIL